MQQHYRLSDYNFATHTASGRIFLFNGLSQAMLRVREEHLVQLRSIEGEPTGAAMPEESLERFLTGRYLIPADEDERARVRQSYESRRYEPASLSITIAPTLRCNLSCPYCFESNDRAPVMSDEVLGRTISFLQSALQGANSSTGLMLCWFGGEPLLATPVIEKINRETRTAAEDLGIPFVTHVITNGVLLTPERMRLLRKGNLAFIQVTLDGPRAAHDRLRRRGRAGTFDRIIANVEQIRAKGLLEGVRFAVRMNVSKGSGGVDDYVALVEELRARGWFTNSEELYDFAHVERYKFSGSADLYLPSAEYRIFASRARADRPFKPGFRLSRSPRSKFIGLPPLRPSLLEPAERLIFLFSGSSSDRLRSN